MKKFYLMFTAMLALFATTAKADRILFSENYEAGGVPATWTINGGTGSIAGDTEGKYFSFALGQINGRSAHCFWGEGIFDPVKEGLTEYTVSIDFQIQAFGNNQVNGEIAIFSGEGCASENGKGTAFAGDQKNVWANYSLLTPNCLFGLAQDSKVATKEDPAHWFVNGDSTDVIAPVAGTWYTLVLNVNVATKEVSYTLDDLDGTFHKAGSKALAADANVFASGLFLMGARYQAVTNIDNVTVSVPGEYANKPVIALTGLNMAERTYTISFLEGEKLNVVLPDGTEKTDIGYYDAGENGGQYVVSTTTSGTLKAYTTVGTMKSEEATIEVVCEPIVLNGVVGYSVVAADEGYAKTYQFTINNSNIEMQPEIFMDFAFKSEDGQHDFTLNNQNSGALVKVESKGTLTATAKAIGYESASIEVVNDVEYIIKHDIDFQHITGNELTEKGFAKLDDINSSNTSGETNWTARLRMYFSIATGEKDDEGNDINIYYPVYGYNAQGVDKNGNTVTQETLDGAKANLTMTPTDLSVVEPIQRYEFDATQLTEEVAHSLFAPFYTYSIGEDGAAVPNLKVNIGAGLIQVGGTNAQLNMTFGVDGLTDKEMIVVSKINDYGNGSIHPQFPAGTDPTTAKEQYKAMHLGAVNEVVSGTQTFQLYRIDTAISRVLVLTPKNGTGIEEINYNKVVSDHNAPIYNLNGVRVDGALKKGIYIKQGKKFIVK